MCMLADSTYISSSYLVDSSFLENFTTDSILLFTHFFIRESANGDPRRDYSDT